MLLDQTVLLALSILAYVAQAMTAALAAGRRSMDWMGVCLLGSIAALGGGSVRDMLLGHYPLVWVKEPWLLLLTAGAAACAIALARIIHHLRIAFLVLDAIGLVVFTIAGCEVALQMNQPLLIVIVAGMITGCVGGVLRDILCNDVPLLFRSELYASVSVRDRRALCRGPARRPQSGAGDAGRLRRRHRLSPAGDSLPLGDAEIRLLPGLELKPWSRQASCCAASRLAQLSVEALPDFRHKAAPPRHGRGTKLLGLRAACIALRFLMLLPLKHT